MHLHTPFKPLKHSAHILALIQKHTYSSVYKRHMNGEWMQKKDRRKNMNVKCKTINIKKLCVWHNWACVPESEWERVFHFRFTHIHSRGVFHSLTRFMFWTGFPLALARAAPVIIVLSLHIWMVRAVIHMKFSQFDALMLVWIAEYIGYKHW